MSLVKIKVNLGLILLKNSMLDDAFHHIKDMSNTEKSRNSSTKSMFSPDLFPELILLCDAWVLQITFLITKSVMSCVVSCLGKQLLIQHGFAT